MPEQISIIILYNIVVNKYILHKFKKNIYIGPNQKCQLFLFGHLL